MALGARRDTEQDKHGVQRHRAALQHRLEHVALDLLHGHDDAEHDERRRRTLRHEGDEHRESTRDERAHDRDEATEEGDDTQGQGQGHVEDDETDSDEDRVDEGHDRLGADEARERVPRAGEDLGEVRAGALTRDQTHPRQESVTVLDEEEGQDEAQHERHEDTADRRHAGEHSGRDDVTGLGDLVVDRADCVVDLLLRNVERRALDPLLNL